MTKQDLLSYHAFKKVIGEGKFEIEGKAVIATASLFTWYNNFEAEIKKHIDEDKKPASFKPLGPPKRVDK